MKNFIMRWKKTPLKKRTKFTENVLELKMLQKRGITQPF